MLKLYFRRIKKPLILALLVSVIVFSNLSVPIALLLWDSISIFSTQIFVNVFRINRAEHQKIASFIISVFAVIPVFLLFSHTFLFFNALPYASAYITLQLYVFLRNFELCIRIPALNLGGDFSLIKLIINPFGHLPILQRRLASDLAARINRREALDPIERSAFEQARALGLITVRNRQRNNAPNPAADQQDPDLLRLPDEDLERLRARQKEALARLPEQAIFRDIEIYESYLTQGLAPQAAVRETDKMVKALETTYRDTLTPEQQPLFDGYRYVFRNISPPYAEDSISLQLVGDHKEYIIMEKRDLTVLNTDKMVPAKTYLWHYGGTFIPLFSMQGSYRACDPNSGENFFSTGDNTKYVFHTYELISDHALSLQLTERIESFARSLSATNEADASHQTDALYRRTPPLAAHLSLQNQGMFQVRDDDTLTDEQLLEMGIPLNEIKHNKLGFGSGH